MSFNEEKIMRRESKCREGLRSMMQFRKSEYLHEFSFRLLFVVCVLRELMRQRERTMNFC